MFVDNFVLIHFDLKNFLYNDLLFAENSMFLLV